MRVHKYSYLKESCASFSAVTVAMTHRNNLSTNDKPWFDKENLFV